MVLFNIAMNVFCDEIKIKPKYIIYCKDKEKKYIYQYNHKEIRTKIDDAEIIHKTYIQNTINNNDIIQNYTYAILIDENDCEHKIDNDFLLKNMFNDIHNSNNREYSIIKIGNIPIKITEKYEKNKKIHQKVTYDKKNFLLCGGTTALLLAGFIGKVIL